MSVPEESVLERVSALDRQIGEQLETLEKNGSNTLAVYRCIRNALIIFSSYSDALAAPISLSMHDLFMLTGAGTLEESNRLIEKAFRQRSVFVHPDKVPDKNDGVEFKILKKASSILQQKVEHVIITPESAKFCLFVSAISQQDTLAFTEEQDKVIYAFFKILDARVSVSAFDEEQLTAIKNVINNLLAINQLHALPSLSDLHKKNTDLLSFLNKVNLFLLQLPEFQHYLPKDEPKLLVDLFALCTEQNIPIEKFMRDVKSSADVAFELNKQRFFNAFTDIAEQFPASFWENIKSIYDVDPTVFDHLNSFTRSHLQGQSAEALISYMVAALPKWAAEAAVEPAVDSATQLAEDAGEKTEAASVDKSAQPTSPEKATKPDLNIGARLFKLLDFVAQITNHLVSESIKPKKIMNGLTGLEKTILKQLKKHSLENSLLSNTLTNPQVLAGLWGLIKLKKVTLEALQGYLVQFKNNQNNPIVCRVLLVLGDPDFVRESTNPLQDMAALIKFATEITRITGAPPEEKVGVADATSVAPNQSVTDLSAEFPPEVIYRLYQIQLSQGAAEAQPAVASSESVAQAKPVLTGQVLEFVTNPAMRQMLHYLSNEGREEPKHYLARELASADKPLELLREFHQFSTDLRAPVLDELENALAKLPANDRYMRELLKNRSRVVEILFLAVKNNVLKQDDLFGFVIILHKNAQSYHDLMLYVEQTCEMIHKTSSRRRAENRRVGVTLDQIYARLGMINSVTETFKALDTIENIESFIRLRELLFVFNEKHMRHNYPLLNELMERLKTTPQIAHELTELYNLGIISEELLLAACQKNLSLDGFIEIQQARAWLVTNYPQFAHTFNRNAASPKLIALRNFLVENPTFIDDQYNPVRQNCGQLISGFFSAVNEDNAALEPLRKFLAAKKNIATISGDLIQAVAAVMEQREQKSQEADEGTDTHTYMEPATAAEVTDYLFSSWRKAYHTVDMTNNSIPVLQGYLVGAMANNRIRLLQHLVSAMKQVNASDDINAVYFGLRSGRELFVDLDAIAAVKQPIDFVNILQNIRRFNIPKEYHVGLIQFYQRYSKTNPEYLDLLDALHDPFFITTMRKTNQDPFNFLEKFIAAQADLFPQQEKLTLMEKFVLYYWGQNESVKLTADGSKLTFLELFQKRLPFDDIRWEMMMEQVKDYLNYCQTPDAINLAMNYAGMSASKLPVEPSNQWTRVTGLTEKVFGTFYMDTLEKLSIAGSAGNHDIARYNSETDRLAYEFELLAATESADKLLIRLKTQQLSFDPNLERPLVNQDLLDALTNIVEAQRIIAEARLEPEQNRKNKFKQIREKFKNAIDFLEKVQEDLRKLVDLDALVSIIKKLRAHNDLQSLQQIKDQIKDKVSIPAFNTADVVNEFQRKLDSLKDQAPASEAAPMDEQLAEVVNQIKDIITPCYHALLASYNPVLNQPGAEQQNEQPKAQDADKNEIEVERARISQLTLAELEKQHEESLARLAKANEAYEDIRTHSASMLFAKDKMRQAIRDEVRQFNLNGGGLLSDSLDHQFLPSDKKSGCNTVEAEKFHANLTRKADETFEELKSGLGPRHHKFLNRVSKMLKYALNIIAGLYYLYCKARGTTQEVQTGSKGMQTLYRGTLFDHHADEVRQKLKENVDLRLLTSSDSKPAAPSA